MHNQPGPAAQQNEQQATDEQVAAGIAAAAALDPILATLHPSEVRAIYAAMVKAGGLPELVEAIAKIDRLQDRLERAEMALNPYFSNGTLGEAWQRGYRGLPVACQVGSDWAKAYAEGAAMRRDGVAA